MRANAALKDDGATCVGWCQFGPTDELPRIKHRRAHLDGLGALPDWRITCFFVGRGYCRRGIASAALEGALHEIARLGEGPWTAIRKVWKAGRRLLRSFITARCGCSR